jgi:hypothetical protein
VPSGREREIAYPEPMSSSVKRSSELPVHASSRFLRETLTEPLAVIDDLRDIAGASLLSAEQIAAAAAVAYTGRDQVMEMEISSSLGYSPGRPGGARSRSGSSFGWSV